MTDVLPKDFVRALGEPAVSTRLLRFTQRLAYFDVVESTNDVAMGLLESGRQTALLFLPRRRLRAVVGEEEAGFRLRE